MTFREDPEGPQDRADRLDEELHDAQRVLHEAREKRLTHLEYEIAHTQEHLGKMQQTLRQLRDEPTSPSSPAARTPAAVGSSGLTGFAKILPVLLPVGMIAMMGFALGHSSAKRCAVRSAQRAAIAKHASVFSPGGLGISQGGLVGEARGASTGNVSLTWTARVKRSTGLTIPVGTTCNLTGDLASDGSLLTGADVSLTCGDKVLYRKGDYNGISALMSVDEFPGPGGKGYGYNLHLEDTTRPSYDKRTQASIDTEARLISVWRDGGTPFKVELDVDEPLARSHDQASPLYTSTARAVAVGARIARGGRVVSATGQSGIAPGARCTVQIAPATQASGWSCRAFVRCGGKSLYGEQGTGYTECTGEEASMHARDVGFTMDDGDPKLDADFAAGRVNISDNDVSSWSVSVKLDDEP